MLSRARARDHARVPAHMHSSAPHGAMLGSPVCALVRGRRGAAGCVQYCTIRGGVGALSVNARAGGAVGAAEMQSTREYDRA